VVFVDERENAAPLAEGGIIEKSPASFAALLGNAGSQESAKNCLI
jgi:hypothetical protein